MPPQDAIVTFHSIDDSGSVLSFPAARLQRLIESLRADDVDIVPLDQLLRPAIDSRQRVALTFDDGLRSVHRQALPILASHGVPATLYVVSGWVGRHNRWPSQPSGVPELELMSWSELEEWRDAGLEIGGHTANHVHLAGLTETQWQTELTESRRQIEEKLEVSVRHFAYPYGTVTDEARRRVAATYETGATTEMGYLTPGTDPRDLPRLDAYYLRGRFATTPLFGLGTRTYLSVRRGLRRLRRAGMGA